MHKLNLLLASLIVVASGCSGLKYAPESHLTFDCVKEAPGYTQSQIFDAAMVWIDESFKSRNQTMEYKKIKDFDKQPMEWTDKVRGVIISNCAIPYPCDGWLGCKEDEHWIVPFQMKIETRDGRFRMTFRVLRLYTPCVPGKHSMMYLPVINQDLDKINLKLMALGDDLLANLNIVKKSDNQ